MSGGFFFLQGKSFFQLPLGKANEQRKVSKHGKRNSDDKSDKPVPPERPPLPSSLVKSPGWKKSNLSAAEHLKKQATLTVDDMQVSDVDRFHSVSDITDETIYVIQTEKLCHNGTERNSAVNSLSLKINGTDLEKNIPPQHPNPSMRYLHDNITERESVNLNVSVSIDIHDTESTSIDANEAKLNMPSKSEWDFSSKIIANNEVTGIDSLAKQDNANRNIGERRRTIIGVKTEHGRRENTTMNSAQYKKSFNGSKGDKPTPPLKPDFVKRHLSLRTPKELEKHLELQQIGVQNRVTKLNISCNQYYSTFQNVLKMNLESTTQLVKNNNSHIMAQPEATSKPTLHSVPFKKVDLIQLKSEGCEAIILSVSLPESTLQSSSQSIAAPPKPPRTHAYDDYLNVSQSFDAKPADILNQEAVIKYAHFLYASANGEDALRCSENPSVRNTYFTGQQPTDHCLLLSPLSSNRNTKDTIFISNSPPARPPPPRRKPNSNDYPVGLSTLSHSFSEFPKAHEGLPDAFHDPSHRHNHLGKKLSNVHDLHSKGKLPPENSLKRLLLQKSFSSECLPISHDRFLIGKLPTDDDISSIALQSSCESQYKPLIDPDGYAVPNVFMRLPGTQNNTVRDEEICVSLKKPLTRLNKFSVESMSPKNVNILGNWITPIHEQSQHKINIRTMNMVRQKINQAYAGVNITQGEVSDKPGSDLEFVDHELDRVMEPTVLKKRIEYCASVRRRSSIGIMRSKEYLSCFYPQLFECCLVVGLRQLVGEDGYEPYVLHRFPDNVFSNVSVPSFCFPDATLFKPGSVVSLSESYSFVMTCSDGSRVYGYCRRVQPPDSSLPEVVCIVSPIDAFNMYNTLLNEIELRRRISLDLASELIAASFGRPLPGPGRICHIRTLDISGGMETIFLNRSTDIRLENVNYESPLYHLGTDNLVKVFSSVLMERRIILYSCNLSVLTQTAHALCALLYPFHWQHVYIPLLPGEMLDAVCAPMPFIVGVLSSFLPRVHEMDLEEVLIVDLDKKIIVKSQGDESTILPRIVQKALKTAINMCKIDKEAHKSQWLMITEAFLRMFIETVGHFINHVCTQQDGNNIFQKEAFILEMVSKELRDFLEWFTETQMFEVFIMNHVEKSDSGTSDLFLQRLAEFKESKEEFGKQKGLGAKVKNFGKALKTKLQAS